ncbi:hypothetical protein TeGR_g11469 [Tetraparma gracilis]|uniref:START domain-containing protein n=1 Tax=Tetraparma gracilis TaxID=2962635 RepID=A0ABQ6MGW4_9STRA|nr:hypothetical protein TeGR_g11469 [Tetraparma gracilis]
MNLALSELQANAAVASLLRRSASLLESKTAEAESLRARLSAAEAELLLIRKQHELVRREDTLFDSMTTTTSKTRMEKVGCALVHLELAQLRRHFLEFLDQTLPAPPSAGRPPPEAIVRAVSSDASSQAVGDTVVLMYRGLAVRNKTGITTHQELFEFHLLLSSDPAAPGLVRLETLPDAQAGRLCGAAHLAQLGEKRRAATLAAGALHGARRLRRAVVAGRIELSAARFGCTALAVTVEAPTAGADQPALPSAARRRLSAVSAVAGGAGAGREPPSPGVAPGGAGLSPEAAEAALSFLACAARNLHGRFARYEEVDEATWADFTARGVPGAPGLSKQEGQLFAKSLAYDNKPWTRILGTVLDTVEYFVVAEKGSAAWGKAVGTVDASVDRVHAWLGFLMSNERCLDHTETEGSLPRAELEVPNSRSKIQVIGVKMPGAIGNRIFVMWYTWLKKEDGTVFVALAPHDDIGDCPEKQRADEILKANHSLVLAKVHGYYEIKPLAENVCRLTFVAQGQMGGNVPNFAMTWAINHLVKMWVSIQKGVETTR